MALQGTIDEFPLTDVLQLLSSSAKSGRLLVEGDRGRAEVWIEGGVVVGGASPVGAAGAAQLVFELLRFADGTYEFGPGGSAPEVDVDPTPLSDCVPQASELLEEWSRITAVVPSRRHRVRPCTELEVESVTLDPQEWSAVVGAGDRPDVATLEARLGLDELACGSLLVALVERGLFEVDEPAATTTPAAAPEAAVDGSSSDTQAQDVATPDAPEDAVADTAESTDAADEPGSAPTGSAGPGPLAEAAPPLSLDERPVEEHFPDHFPIDDLLGAGEDDASAWDDESDGSRFAAAQTFEPLGAEAFAGDLGAPTDLPERTAEAWDDVVAGTGHEPVGSEHEIESPWQELPEDGPSAPAEDGADEVLRQMSRLSPKAAEAIAAALNTPSASTPLSHDVRSDAEGDGPGSFLGSL